MINKIRMFQGRVVSDRMNKTIVVLVERKVEHQLYGKFVTKSTRYHTHDEMNTCREGDTVKITETKPYSKTKKWCLVSVVKRAK
jgi:small subunit ribosomal protein S17